jgi:hypothetical protein
VHIAFSRSRRVDAGMAQKAKYVPTIDPNGPSIFTAVQE